MLIGYTLAFLRLDVLRKGTEKKDRIFWVLLMILGLLLCGLALSGIRVVDTVLERYE